jgi:drug/metabolite transporter (DMT)-like permease
MDIMLAVALRFAIAAALIGIWCIIKGVSLKQPFSQHKWILLAGVFLYTLDYSFLYAAQQHMISALLAVLSSSVIYFNVILRRFALGAPIRIEVVIGATVGLVGIACIFAPEFEAFTLQQGITLGLLFATASFFAAACGNVTSEKILKGPTGVMQMNFWAMTYGVIITTSIALLNGAEFSLPSEPSFYYSLLYLSLFGSVVAFGAYMRLLKQIGSDKSAYVVLVYPIVALLISTIFEGYEWSLIAVVGAGIVLLGNAIAMGKLNKVMRVKPL